MTGQGTSPGLVATMIAAVGSTDYLAGYTLIGASSTWARTGTGSIWLTRPTNGSVESLKAVVWTPTGATWTHSFELGKLVTGAASGVGVIVRDSVSGRCLAFALHDTGTSALYRLPSLTTFSAGVATVDPPPATSMWLTVTYDGTNLVFYAGYGLGDQALLLVTEAKASFLAATPDQVGVYMDPYDGAVSCAVRARLVA